MYRLAAVLTAAFVAVGLGAGAATARPIDAYCSLPEALGVSRFQSIDTTGGPRFGLQFQPEGTSFLAPGEVVLTFDDGPYAPTTGAILDTLDRFCTKATFFAVGRLALSQQETLKSLVSRGHTLGGHTWAHANLSALGVDRRAVEVEKGFSALSEIVGPHVAPFFRFPYLTHPEAELERLSKRNVAVFAIDIDSTDSHGQHVSGERIVSQTLKQLEMRGKGIILLHDLKSNTAKALPALLQALKEKGYRIVHIVPAAPFEPNAAFSAEVAEKVIEKAQTKVAANTAVPARRQAAKPVVLKASRNVGKGRTARQRSTAGDDKLRKGKRGKHSKVEAKNGPFRRSI
ncbi:MAG: polysaccharide deacetylase family protein [Hyphomicrobiaceae bacterium]